MWRQLRWRLVGAQMLVVFVGVTALAVAAELALRAVPNQIQATLSGMTPDLTESAIDAATKATSQTLQQVLMQSLLVAAVAATLAGLLTSILLIREILRPLQEIAHGSRRIADGHYDERVAVPFSDELAMVATNFNMMAESLGEVESQRVTMIGNVAHELRTPLTGLRGYLEGLMDGLFPTDGETFAHMYHEVRRLQRLVDDLQALSRVEAGQLDLRLEPFDVVPVVNQVLSQIRPQALAHNLTLDLDCETDSLVVYADRDRTAQVLINLMSNALRYTPDDGAITVCIRRAGRHAAIAVQDTGVGIAPEDLPHIFDRFYRADPSRTRASGGSGIGLTIARYLTWGMGGELTVQSDGPNQGSTFIFTLPPALPTPPD